MNNFSDLQERILSLLPADGSTMGNKAVQEALADAGVNGKIKLTPFGAKSAR